MLRHLALALLCLSAAAAATAAPRVDLTVIDRERNDRLDEYRHRGDTWIAGTPGHRYAVRLHNRSPERVLVVLSVDGVNAVTGETAHPSQAGYVLEPWASTEVSGWRKSMRSVAQFVFTDLPDSYAARTGRPDNVGVIGVAVFEEARINFEDRHGPRPPAIARSEGRDASTAAPAAQASRESASQELGTGHGRREWSPVSRTHFVRSTRHPIEVSELRYDDYRALVARGIVPRQHRRPHRDAPRAFPDGFVADPPRRNW